MNANGKIVKNSSNLRERIVKVLLKNLEYLINFSNTRSQKTDLKQTLSQFLIKVNTILSFFEINFE